MVQFTRYARQGALNAGGRVIDRTRIDNHPRINERANGRETAFNHGCLIPHNHVEANARTIQGATCTHTDPVQTDKNLAAVGELLKYKVPSTQVAGSDVPTMTPGPVAPVGPCVPCWP